MSIMSSYLPVELHDAYDEGAYDVLHEYCCDYVKKLGNLYPPMNKMFVIRLPNAGLHRNLVVENRRGYSVRGGMVACAHPLRYARMGGKGFGVEGSVLSVGDVVVYIKLAEKIFYWRGMEVCVVHQPDVMCLYDWGMGDRDG